jgi:hypothetical protein
MKTLLTRGVLAALGIGSQQRLAVGNMLGMIRVIVLDAPRNIAAPKQREVV